MENALVALFYLARPLMSIKVESTLLGLNFFEFLTMVLTLSLGIVAAILGMAPNRRKKPLSTLEWSMVVFISWCTATYFAFIEVTTFKQYTKWVLPLITYMVLKRAFKDRAALVEKLPILFFAFAIPVFASVAVIMRGSGVDEDVYLTGFIRYRGVYNGSHEMAHNMGFLIMLIGVYVAIRKVTSGLRHSSLPGWNYPVFALLVLGSLYCIYFGQVRTVIVGLALFVGSYLFFYSKPALVGGIVIAAFSVLVFSETYSTIFYDILPVKDNPRQIERAGSGRPMIWKHNLAIFEKASWEHKLAGLGIGNWHGSNEPEPGQRQIVNSHNDWLQTMLEVGVIGLVILLIMYFLMLCAILRMRSAEKYAFISLWLAVVFMNFVSNSYVSRVPLAQLFFMLLVYVELTAEQPWTQRPTEERIVA